MIKKFTYFLVAVIFFGGLFWLLSQPPKSGSNLPSSDETVTAESKDKYKNYPVHKDPDLTFYWGNGCPHCENVEKWLDENNTEQKIKVNYKEVYYNQTNQQELSQIVEEYCPELLGEDGIGVPLGFDPNSKKCIQGDTPIIEFLSDKLGY